MKTANSIEQQESRKETEKAKQLAQNSKPVRKTNSEISPERIARIAPYRFQPGKSGNPGGKPRVDRSAEIARALFEDDGPAIYAAFQKALRKGSAYAFQVLADRGFGKLKEKHEIEVGPFHDLTEEQLQQRVVELERELGIDHTAPALLPPDDSKPN